MGQLCAVDLAHSKVLGDVPILVIAWSSPKIANKYLAEWADKMHPMLRILRIRVASDRITKMPPDWLWCLLTGGYKHMGIEITLRNEHLYTKGVLKDKGERCKHGFRSR